MVLLPAGLLLTMWQLLSGLDSTGIAGSVAPCAAGREKGLHVAQEKRQALHGEMPLSPFLTGRMFVRPNILRILRRTMICFLIELLVRRIWFGQSKLYCILNWLVMRCKLRPELAADAQQTA